MYIHLLNSFSMANFSLTELCHLSLRFHISHEMGSKFYWILWHVTLYVICHHRTNINTESPENLKSVTMKYDCVPIWKKMVMTNFSYYYDPSQSEYLLIQQKSEYCFCKQAIMLNIFMTNLNQWAPATEYYSSLTSFHGCLNLECHSPLCWLLLSA